MILATTVFLALAFTTLGLIFKQSALFLLAAIVWLLFGIVAYNTTYSANDAINEALIIVGLLATLVTSIMALNYYMKARAERSSGLFGEEAEEEAYKRKVRRLTKKERHW